jgi:drug/metabolite transporter (DMT)-like permease
MLSADGGTRNLAGEPASKDRPRLSRRGALLFAALCVIWGLPYLLIRVAVRDVSPAFLVFARTGMAALLLLPLAARRRQLRVVLGQWRWLLAFTFTEIAVPWFLLSRAEERLTSSLTGLLIAAVPLIGGLLTAASGSDHQLDRRAWSGLLVGLLGVGAMVGLDFGRVGIGPLAEVVVVVTGYACGPLILARRLMHLPSLGVISLALALTSLAYATPALLTLPAHLHTDAVLSIVGLAVICTALAFLVFFALIAAIGPVRATIVTYVNPAVAALLGVLVLDERFTVGMGTGFLLVLGGSLLATGRRRLEREPGDASHGA